MDGQRKSKPNKKYHHRQQQQQQLNNNDNNNIPLNGFFHFSQVGAEESVHINCDLLASRYF